MKKTSVLEKVHRKKVHERFMLYRMGPDACIQKRMHNKKKGEENEQVPEVPAGCVCGSDRPVFLCGIVLYCNDQCQWPDCEVGYAAGCHV